jgi:competence protein ComEC
MRFPARAAVLISVAHAAIVSAQRAEARAPALEIRFINVGQGDAILIREGARAVLVDAGLPNDSIVEKLRALDVDSLDLFVASHNHGDHIGSAAAVVSGFPVRLFIDNGAPVHTSAERDLQDALQRRKTPQMHAPRRTISLGDTRVTIIPPPAGVDTFQNNHSMVVLVERGKFRALLTGDSERSEIDALVAHEPLSHVDVLKAPHHGDTTAVTDEWLRRLSPDVVIISSADADAIGSARARYDSLKRTIAATYWDGDIVVVVSKDGSYSVQARSGRVR